MYELKTKQLHRWHGSPAMPIYLDVACPSCSRSLANNKASWTFMRNREAAWSYLQCSYCEADTFFFLFDPNPEVQTEGRQVKVFMEPSPLPDLRLPDDVNWREVSPRFVHIYEQVVNVELLGFEEMVGIGYRKAFEVLIKDYLAKRHPESEGSIQNMNLGECITTYIDDPRVRETAQKTVWLMNDETHFVRLHVDNDLEDLKRLLGQSIHYLAIEILNDGDMQSITNKKRV